MAEQYFTVLSMTGSVSENIEQKKKNQDDLIAISKDLVINVDIYDLQIFHCMHTQLII